MIKEIKYLIFVLFIFFFFFFTIKYYFSDLNKINSNRVNNDIDEKLLMNLKNLPILEDDTNDSVQYLQETNINKKKKYNFWELIEKNE
ncbi:MAG: hypothetical protein CK535_05320 [Pelagibacteraceae bacterium]|nr:MAG: hypothetical protein CK535_05320 [Pelagibacteraceae bacterium]